MKECDATLLHFGKEVGKVPIGAIVDGVCADGGDEGYYLQYWFPNDIVVRVPVLDDGTPDSLGEVTFAKKKGSENAWYLDRIYHYNCSALFV